ncbi:hypothetical protein Tco_1221400 [Tanacetum coccineum]
MDSENYKEGQSMQRSPLFEADSFIYWKNRFETYVKSKDIDLWHAIIYGDYKPTIINEDTGNKQVKDNKIDLFVQKYEELTISDDETIDCAFARFNTIITSLKSLDDSFSSRNHVRKFLWALTTRWRLKVRTIEESNDLSTLPRDELIGNLKVYEVVLEKDSETSKNKKEKYKSVTLKAKKVSSDEEVSCFGSSYEEYETTVRDFKKFFSSDEEKQRKYQVTNMSLVQVRLKVKLDPDEWIKDNRCLRHMMGNKDLFSTYIALHGGNVVFGSNTKSKIIGKDYLTEFDLKSTKGVSLGYSPNSKAYIILNKETMRIEESLNVRFDESPPPKSSPLVDDDIIESQIVENQIENIEEKENGPLNKEIMNIKESKDHPIKTVIGKLNERTLKSQVQKQSNFFYFVFSVEPKNIKEAIKDESWTMTMQKELNQFVTNDV